MAPPSPDFSHTRTASSVASPPYKMRSRTQSISSDRPSTQAYSLMSPPLSVSPEAAFIATSAASQIVTNDHDTHAEAWFDQHGIEPSGETAMVSPAALQLVNNFLDQLLLNFLSVAHSTKLTALRPAVSEVLKPKLAKDAMNQADEELDEYLGGNADEDYAISQQPVSARDWDLELVWKRTRLRCMVYSSLGDLEEEDEDFYMEREHLDTGLEEGLRDIVSPAVAIFLTSILEFLGEQALIIAGQAAFHRLRTRYQKELREGGRDPAHTAERIVIEELDMERVALDRTLGRLWRTWKKKIRNPNLNIDSSFGRPGSSSSNRTGGVHSRKTSLGMEHEVPPPLPETAMEQLTDKISPVPIAMSPEEVFVRAAGIPLPETARDMDEIEVPGLAYYSDEDSESEEVEPGGPETQRPRPKSLMFFPLGVATDLPTPVLSEPHTPMVARKRSNSVPTPAATPFTSPSKRSEKGEQIDDVQDSEDGSDSAIEVASSSSGEQPASRSQRVRKGDSTSASNHDRFDSESAADDMVDSTARPISAVTAQHALGKLVDPHRGLPSVSKSSRADEGGDDESADEAEEAEEADDFTEEPQILTSARISVHGRISPVKPDGQTSPPLSALPARSASVHSVRMVDVHNPRSPTTRSRGSSLEASDRSSGSRTASYSRPNSMSAAPISDVLPTVTDGSQTSRVLAPAASVKPSRGGLNESISEAEEGNDDEAHGQASPLTPASEAALPTPLDPRNVEGLGWIGEEEAARGTAIFGSAAERSSSPTRTSPRSVTKVTILSRPTNGETPNEDRPEPVRRYSPPAAAAMYGGRMTSRQPGVNGNGPLVAATTSSIGLVSVDRHAQELPPVPESPEQRLGAARQLHTSGSSTSSGTRHLAVRTSDEHVPVRAGDVARNFEELIHSDQTIQYTLTPETMRNIETTPASQQAPSSVITVRSRKSEEARHDLARARAGSDSRMPELRRSPSTSHSQALGSHPVDDLPVVVKPPGYSSRANGAKPHPSAQPRDARPTRESMSHFANFIRTTGPRAGQADPAPTRGPASTMVRNLSGPVPASKGSFDSVTNPNKARLLPREAAVDYRDDHSDLIDFIRRGPAAQSGSGTHRIPRAVAPFRTTMDSDQMSGAVGGRAVDATVGEIRTSQNSNAAEKESLQSSVTSQTALLRNNRPSPTSNGVSMFGDDNDDDHDEGGPVIPQRKQRRVRDPYAIDLSDEEVWDDSAEQSRMAAPPKRAQTNEESLLDFLNSVPPPPEPTVEPFHIQQAQARPKKKSSAPSLITRLSGGVRREAAGSFSKTAEARLLSSRAGSVKGRGYTPIQIPGLPSKGIGSQQSFSNASSAHAQGLAGRDQPQRVIRKRFEPREAVSVPSRGTSDLADFFRSSGPPSSGGASGAPYGGPAMGGAPSRGYDDPSGFARLLARRKKSAAA